MSHQHNTAHTPQLDSPLKRYKFIFLAFLAIGFFYLAVEHTAHLFGYLPLLFLLACPLLHVFMHGGHKHEGPHPTPKTGPDSTNANPSQSPDSGTN